jgi:transposase
MLNGMLWRAKTGPPWRDVPARYGKWQTVYSRWLRWRDAGVWQRVWEALQQEANQRGDVAWDIPLLDSASVRAHQHAAGAKKARRQRKA